MAERKLNIQITGDAKGAIGAMGLTGAEAEKMSGKFDGAGSKVAGVFKAMAVAGVAGGLAVGAALIKVGSEFEDARNTIRVGTGATGDALKGLEGDFNSVVSAVPASFKDASGAIAEINTRLGLTGAPLQDLSKQFLEVSRITGTDVATNIDSVTKLFGNFGVAAKDQGSAMDQLFRTTQVSGIGFADLSDAMTKLGPVARTAGLSFSDTAGLVGTLSKAGVDAASVMPALSKSIVKAAKEHIPAAQLFKDTFAAIKASPDGTKAAGDAAAVFGAKAGPKLAALIREGKLSYDDMVKSIKGGKDTIMKAGDDTMTLGDKFKLMKNKAMVALEPIASKALGGIMTAIDTLTKSPKFAEFVDKAKAVFENLGALLTDKIIPAVRKVGDAFMSGARAVEPIVMAVGRFIKANPTPILAGLAVVVGGAVVAALVSMGVAMAAAFSPIYLVVGAIALLVGGLVYAYEKVGWFRNAVDAVGRFLKDVVGPAIGAFARQVGEFFGQLVGWVRQHWGEIQSVIATVVNMIRGIISGFIGAVQSAWQTFGGTILSFVQSVWQAIQHVIEGVMNVIGGIIRLVMAVIHGDWAGAWNAIKQVVSGALDIVRGVIDGGMALIRGIISGAWDAIKGVFSGAWDGIVGFVKSGIDRAVEVVKGIGGMIWNAIGDLGGLLLQKGKDLVQGLINGIKHAPGAILDAIKSLIPGGGAVVDAAKSLFGLASGGPADAGVPYIVGENGPEIMVPHTAGTVIPNHAIKAGSGTPIPMGGGGTMIHVEVNVAGTVQTERNLAESVRSALIDIGRRTGQPVLAGY